MPVAGLDNVKINKYAKFDPFKSYEAAEIMLSKPLSVKKGCWTFQSLDNFDMHLYAKFDKNIPSCSRVMSIFTN